MRNSLKISNGVKDKKTHLPVFLVNVASKQNQIMLPIGLTVLVNSLRHHNIEPQLIDLQTIDTEKRESFLRETLSKEQAIYGFGIIAGNYHLPITEKYAKIILDVNPDNIIVYGGPLPTSVPELLFEKCLPRYIIAGEGEISFPKLINALSNGDFYPKDIQGLYYKKDGTIFGSKPKWIRQLDHLSNPDCSLFDMDFYIEYLKQTGQSFQIMASRGCRGNCSFCYKFCGYGLSRRSADSVLDEISDVINKHSLRRFYFVDENFLESKSYFLEFIKGKKERKLDFTFITQARIDTIDEEFCKVGSENGLTGLSTGMESATQKTLDRINKRITVEEIEYKIKIMNKYNINITANFIVGFPWEQEEDFIALVNFLKKNGLEKRVKLSYLTPLPATRDFRAAIKAGKIKDCFEYIKNLGDIYWEQVINLTSLPDSLLDYYYNKINKLSERDVIYPKDPRYLKKLRKIH